MGVQGLQFMPRCRRMMRGRPYTPHTKGRKNGLPRCEQENQPRLTLISRMGYSSVSGLGGGWHRRISFLSD